MTSTLGKGLPDRAHDLEEFAVPRSPAQNVIRRPSMDAAAGEPGLMLVTAANSETGPELADNEAGLIETATGPNHRRAALVRRFELPLLLFAGLGPAVIAWAGWGRAFFTESFVETTAMLVGSIMLSWYILYQLKDHPNARRLSYVLPVNLFVFSAILALVALVRIPYSGSYFTVGAVCAAAASFLTAVYERRLEKLHLVVPGGRADEIVLDSQYRIAPPAAAIERMIATGWREWAIVADLHHPHSEQAERIFAKAALAGIPVYHFRTIAEAQTGQVKITHLSENDLGSLIPNLPYLAVKRVIDIIGVLVLMPVCLPLFAGLALLIRLDSPGRAFFIQERMGYRGQTFRIVKFRTMRELSEGPDTPADRDSAKTRSDDERITRIGRFLRKSRLDELPQIFNVLRGDMSIIGPRPEACALSAWYDAELPFYPYRHIVRPGITGWAQVNQGHVTEVSDVLDKLRFDFYYIKNISLWLDLLIALKTVRVMVQGHGAR
jgi:exopolysaccharide biosynthesis polyprenyl glycosylphosphotransferase